ncbi:NAD(P)-dependent oxidoreductase [Rhizobium sp. SSA_523]|uniref:NAD(P)-dependent oxidoreductase n=1 Tax=Rhizobium sp. SSA_523 TaxID=2952477 RepID=UPI00209002CE|nr:NAD(P)-dependent oxidoreductase [Rhizobium sp. SSA_523]MCO5731260.1 NAD(P)-dependent oxidoreductase [Rhizobium sp. SSA_523]WKC22202.1 NAD(P)-dependent oxidoreductase [Rhizobium sp. SSA_523]
MHVNPILMMGGSGAIGHLSATTLRRLHPDLPFLIAGRDMEKARAVAEELGNAEAVQLDLKAEDLGLGDRKVGAVAVFYADNRLAGLRFAQARDVPHLSISSGIFEIAPEIGSFMHRPRTSAVVLGYEWLVGATTIPTLEVAKSFGHVATIKIGALVDEEDGGGPAVAEDFERLSKMMPAALTRRDGAYIWRQGEDAEATFHAIDGTEIKGSGFSSIDVVGLATATGAGDVQFDLATGVSSSRRRGEPKSTEIVIAVSGTDHDGRARQTRHAVFHPGGAAPLTAMGVATILERLTGLDGREPASPGLYFPYQLIEPALYLRRLEAAGGGLMTLEPR